MTKADLIAEASMVLRLTKKESEPIVSTIFEEIAGALVRGEKVELRGFGTFRIRHRDPRPGRNPKTGARIDVPPKRVPFFKAGKALRHTVKAQEQVGHARLTAERSVP